MALGAPGRACFAGWRLTFLPALGHLRAFRIARASGYRVAAFATIAPAAPSPPAPAAATALAPVITFRALGAG